MIEIDQKALDAQLQRFSESVAGKAAWFGVAIPQVLKLEANRLAQTLMRITPPRDKDAAGKRINDDVRKKFGLMAGVDESFAAKFNPPVAKQGKGATVWFLWTPSVLMGVARSKDMRGEPDEAVYKAYWNSVVSRSGRMDEGSRGKQKIRVIKRHIFGEKQVKALVDRLKKHLGRQKSGWAVSWKATGEGSGIYRPPQWVLKHLDKGSPRGRCFLDKLQNKDIPSVWLQNTAKHIGDPSMMRLAHQALKIRLEAMTKNVANIVKLQKRGVDVKQLEARESGAMA